MDWKYFPSDNPPKDTHILVYYENGKLDKGYLVLVDNSETGFFGLPDNRNYILIKWVKIE
ncbi:MAG: hypothetical protein V4509_01820 [Patescibacteria group bacterium]